MKLIDQENQTPYKPSLTDNDVLKKKKFNLNILKSLRKEKKTDNYMLT
jgi:hypothetical protein